tara:strand:- start:422 stop:1066 length:645 start_codon:yes stop_codon:yes gene_type:complete
MNTHKLLFVGLAIIVLGLIAYFAIPASDDVPNDATNQQDTDIVSEKDSGSGSFLSLMERDENIACTFTSDTEGTKSAGMFYYSDGKYRVESETETDGMTFTSNMIGLEDKSYIWGTSPQGDIALVVANDAVDAEESAREFADRQEESTIDLEEGVVYNCNPWQPVPALLEPPSDIEFMDMQEMLESMFSGEMPDMPEGFEMPEGMEIPADLQMQ